MKIAMIGQKGMPAKFGGVERHVHDLSVRLAKYGFDITVYSRTWYSNTDETSVEGVSLIHTPTIKTKHLDTIVHVFTSTIHAIFSHYDIIHYHGVGPALLSWIPRIFAPKTKVITTFHSIDRYHQKWNWIAKLFLRIGEWAACTFSHETITVSQSLHQYCTNEFEKDTVYIPNGIETDIKAIPSDKHIKQFGLTPDNYLVMVSRLIPHKGAHILIEAFANLKRNHKNDEIVQNLKLAIVGGSAYTDEYVQQLHLQASLLNDVVFTDFQSGETLKALYIHAKALIHPSMNEGLPITVLEAMTYGKVVLASSIPEHIEVLGDSRSLFKENDVNALETKLYEFLNMSREEISRVEKRNKDIIQKTYSWDVVVPDIVELYQKAIRKNKTEAELQNVQI
ncbi:MAG: glycosyltransferase family 4 protein [Candidatus Magasanikbacteria bacterium]